MTTKKPIGISNRVLTIGPLSPKQIESAVSRFEAEMQSGTDHLTLSNGQSCGVCISESRTQINRRLLEGESFFRLQREYKIAGNNSLGDHYRKHLIPSMEPELSQSLMNLATRIEAYRRFPITATEYKQIEWCLGQFMAIRQMLLDALASQNPSLTDFRRKVLKDYGEIVGRIRDSAVLMQSARRKRPQTADNLEDIIPEEQHKALEDARKKRQEAEHDQQMAKNSGEDNKTVGGGRGTAGPPGV